MRGTPLLLLIDDNRDVLIAGARMLATCGFEVEVARNGADGIAKALALEPEIVVVDIMMPGTSGYDVCRRLRSNRRTEHLPIIGYTAVTAVSALVPLFELGVQIFAIKPCVPTVIAEEALALLRAPSAYPAIKVVTGYGETLDALADAVIRAARPHRNDI
jgi:DNA-binding response OmpR family regulator